MILLSRDCHNIDTPIVGVEMKIVGMEAVPAPRGIVKQEYTLPEESLVCKGKVVNQSLHARSMMQMILGATLRIEESSPSCLALE